VRRAERDARIAAVTALASAMSEDWRAALSYLERRYPAEWANINRHEVSGLDGEAMELRHER
jgi:hypothetical protein